jgi:hypothetical protein
VGCVNDTEDLRILTHAGKGIPEEAVERIEGTQGGFIGCQR